MKKQELFSSSHQQKQSGNKTEDSTFLIAKTLLFHPSSEAAFDRLSQGVFHILTHLKWTERQTSYVFHFLTFVLSLSLLTLFFFSSVSFKVWILKLQAGKQLSSHHGFFVITWIYIFYVNRNFLWSVFYYYCPTECRDGQRMKHETVRWWSCSLFLYMLSHWMLVVFKQTKKRRNTHNLIFLQTFPVVSSQNNFSWKHFTSLKV